MQNHTARVIVNREIVTLELQVWVDCVERGVWQMTGEVGWERRFPALEGSIDSFDVVVWLHSECKALFRIMSQRKSQLVVIFPDIPYLSLLQVCK